MTRILVVLASIMFATWAAVLAHAAEPDVALVLDQAKVMKLPAGGISSLVLGNPLIADAVIGRGGILILTGKSFGKTNLIFLNASGDVIAERQLVVRGASGVVTVVRGMTRSTYSCNPICQPMPALGDGKADFDQNLAQINARNGASQSVTTSERPKP